MIASKNSESILETDLQSDKKCHCLYRVITAIDVITHEQVVGVGGLSSNFEELSKVMELSMNIATDCDRCSYLLDIGFINQDFFCLCESQITISSKTSRLKLLRQLLN